MIEANRLLLSSSGADQETVESAERRAGVRLIEEVAERGAALLPSFIAADACEAIALELAQHQFVSPKPYNPSQVSETYTRLDWGTSSELLKRLVTDLAGNLVALASLAAHRFPVLAAWQPNDISIQRYEKGQGISAHRDIIQDHGIVAVINISGQALFHLHESRESTPHTTWQLTPGGAVFLRATGLDSRITAQGCPFHSVEGVSDEARISIGFRQRIR